MRFARILCGSSRLGILTSVALVAALAAGGCDSVGHIEHSWFAPNEMGRYKSQPLLLPIVTTLDTGVEEPNDLFTSASDVKAEDLQVTAADYVVGKNDLLSISITDLVAPGVETVKSARVSESGNISLPLIGQLKAEGVTESQLETEIQKAYRDANLMPNAQVSVSVQQALARTFSIIGSVQRPALYQITQADFRILDALVAAGDITSQGVDYLYVVRREDLAGPTSAPAMAPGTAPAAPGKPNDVLTPRSSVDPTDYTHVKTLLADAPAAAGTNGAAGSGDGHYIIVDGKPVLVAPQGAATPAAAPAAPADAATAAPAAPGTPAAPAATPMAPTTQSFEFAGPTSGPKSRIIKVPVTMLKNGDLRDNIVIHPQDMIIAPPPTTGEYYMDGHINRGGVYSLTARNITLKQAVAAAGGLDALAIPSTKTEIIRRIGTDKEVFASVDLDKVASGLQPDIYLKPNDIVRVGTNAFAPFVAAFRNAFRITYGFGFLYDRNYAPQQTQNN